MIVLANRFAFSTASSASVFISFLFPVSLPALFPVWKILLPEAPPEADAPLFWGAPRQMVVVFPERVAIFSELALLAFL